jgi:hypothetical protein
MKKLLILILLVSCSKYELSPSDEVLLTVINECRCDVEVSSLDETRSIKYLYDCAEEKVLHLKMERGTYKIKSENFTGQVVIDTFTKGNYSQNLNIEF